MHADSNSEELVLKIMDFFPIHGLTAKPVIL